MSSTQVASSSEGNPEGSLLTSQQRLQLAWQLFTAIEYQVQVADRKVQAVFGANTLMVAALTLHGQSTLAEFKLGGLTPLEMFLIGLRIALLCTVCASAGFAILALTPRVRRPTLYTAAAEGIPTVELRPNPRSYFFFGDVSIMPVDQFVQGFRNLSPEEATEQLIRQAHQVSAVVNEKYRWSRRAARALTGSLFLWIFVLLLRFLT